MKVLIVLMLVFGAVSCSSEKKVQPGQNKVLKSPGAQTNVGAAFMEENDMCICTKDWNPVCGDGQTYPNACQADCEKVKKYTEGACE